MGKHYKLTRAIGRAILYLILIAGALVAITPFFWMISTSLMSLGETINRAWVPSNPQWINYVNAWDEANFSRYFWNSVQMTAITMVGLLFTSILAGYAFARINFKGRGIIFAILLGTMMIPESITVIPNQLLIRGYILPLPGVDLRAFDLCVSDGGGWLACRVENFIMGASWINTLKPLTIPVMTVTLFGFIGSWNSFVWPLLVTTRDVSRPIMVGLWNFVTEAGPQTHLLMAGAVITLIPILIVYFITQKQFTEGIATTGLKG